MQTKDMRPGRKYGVTTGADKLQWTSVQFVEVSPPGCPNAIHVNGNECWPIGLPVVVK